MAVRLHINLSQGLLEAEGEERFVRDMLAEFKADLANAPVATPSTNKAGSDAPKSAGNKSGGNSGSKATGTKKKASEPKVDKNLDLSGGAGKKSLNEFCAQYNMKTNMDRNVVFVAYLSDELELENVTISHVWSCYVHMKIKLPKDMAASLRDTGKDKFGARLNASLLENLSLSVPGKNWFLEPDSLADSASS